MLQTNLANKTVGVYKSLGAIKMEIIVKGKVKILSNLLSPHNIIQYIKIKLDWFVYAKKYIEKQTLLIPFPSSIYLLFYFFLR